jgi:hypothetical protein
MFSLNRIQLNYRKQLLSRKMSDLLDESAPAPKSEPVHESAPAPKSEPVHESAPAPKSEPVHESAPAPKSEPVHESAKASVLKKKERIPTKPLVRSVKNQIEINVERAATAMEQALEYTRTSQDDSAKSQALKMMNQAIKMVNDAKTAQDSAIAYSKRREEYIEKYAVKSTPKMSESNILCMSTATHHSCGIIPSK